MVWLKQLLGLLPTGVGMIADHFEAKRELKRVVAESERRVVEAKANAAIDLAAKGQAADVDWESRSLDQSGWKDEYWTITLSIPFIMGFIPGAVPYVRDGFAAFATMPEWYQYVLAVVITAPFGVRVLGRGTDVVRNALAKGR